MKFKIDSKSTTYKKLMDLKKKVTEYNEQADALVKKLGGLRYCKDQDAMAGGISAIEFTVKPEGWRMVGEKHQRLYFPKVSEKEVLYKISLLPTVNAKEFNEIINFKAPQMVSEGRGIAVYHSLKLKWGEKIILIKGPDSIKYKPAVGMIEILDSEYQKLWNRINKEIDQE